MSTPTQGHLSRLPWRKSTRSGGGNGGSCVEVAPLVDGTGRVALRDSKDPGGPVLVCSPGAWTAFLAAVQAGDLTRPE